MLHAFYLLFFSSKYIQAEFQTDWILIMSHSHLHRITARASSLPSVCEIITIHHGRPCRIEISHPRGRKFNQGRGFWLNFRPLGRDISILHGQAHDGSFFSHFSKGFCQNIKTPRKPEISNFLLVGFRLFLSSRVSLSDIKMGVNIVCTLLLPGKHHWSIS